MRSEVTANCTIAAPLVSLLREKGYEVETFKPLKGSSGIEHSFDIVATENGKHIVFAVAFGTDEMSSEFVVSYFAKIYDVAPHRSVLIALPRLGREARKLAGLFGLEVVEGESIQEVLQSLRPRFREVKPEALQREPFETPAPPTPQMGALGEASGDEYPVRQVQTIRTTPVAEFPQAISFPPEVSLRSLLRRMTSVIRESCEL